MRETLFLLHYMSVSLCLYVLTDILSKYYLHKAKLPPLYKLS